MVSVTTALAKVSVREHDHCHGPAQVHNCSVHDWLKRLSCASNTLLVDLNSHHSVDRPDITNTLQEAEFRNRIPHTHTHTASAMSSEEVGSLRLASFCGPSPILVSHVPPIL